MNLSLELGPQLNWLLNHSLQAGLLVLVVLSVQWLFRHRLTNRWRFALWWIVLARMLLPFSPQSAISLFNLFQPAVQIGSPVNPVRLPAAHYLPLPMGPVEDLVKLAPTRPAATNSTQALNFRDCLVPGLAGLWLAGALVLCGTLLAQLISFNRKLARTSAPAKPELQSLLDDCRREFGVSRAIDILETDAVQSPALFGLLRLRLLLPHSLGAQFDGRELRYIFLHELAHVKRGDLWLNWLVTTLQILHWFNPLLWLGFARLRADRELACDEMALLRAGDSTCAAYGETVVKLLENMSRPAAIPGLVGILEDKDQMCRRISMIANFHRPGRWSASAVILIASVAVVALTDAQSIKPIQSHFAPASLEQSNAAPKAAVWTGRSIEGTLHVGHHIGTNEALVLYPCKSEAATDEAGRFAFGPIPAGRQELCRKIQFDDHAWLISPLCRLDVKPFETIVTNIGGQTVVGRLEFSGTQVDFTNGTGFISTPPFWFNERHQHLKTEAELLSYAQSPEMKAALNDSEKYPVRVSADGTFRADNLQPGTYEFVFEPDLWRNLKDPMLSSVQILTVPKLKNQGDDLPIQWGVVKLLKVQIPGPNAIDLVQVGKDTDWRGGYVLHIAKRDGASIEDIQISRPSTWSPDDQKTTITADTGSLSPGSAEDPADGCLVQLTLKNVHIKRGQTETVLGKITFALRKD